VLQKSRHHPLGQKLDVLALAAAASSEWQAQLRARGLPETLKLERLQRAVGGFAAWAAWSLAPAGRMLHAKLLAATGQLPAAQNVLRRLAREPYPDAWRRCAMLELAAPEGADEALLGRRQAVAAFVAEAGRLDGRLEERSWRQQERLLLRPQRAAGAAGATSRDGGPASALPAVQVVRSAAGFVIFAFRLPRAPGRQWDVAVAIDADRDTWTQVVLRFDTGGRRSAGLAFRHGPTANLGLQCFQLQGFKSQDAWTFELAVPLKLFSIRPPPAELWDFQVLATLREMTDDEVRHYYQPQDDPQLLPERYGLLKIPAAALPGPRTPPAAAPSARPRAPARRGLRAATGPKGATQ
jgi:hypothetical protein